MADSPPCSPRNATALHCVTTCGNVSRGQDPPWQLRLSVMGRRPRAPARARLSRRSGDRQMGSREQVCDARQGHGEDSQTHRGARKRGQAVKIRRVAANNRKKTFEVRTYKRIYDFPYARTVPRPGPEARKCMDSSRLSKREVIRRLGTSASQLYRLLDPTNNRKSLRQLMSLLAVLGYVVDIDVARSSALRVCEPDVSELHPGPGRGRKAR